MKNRKIALFIVIILLLSAFMAGCSKSKTEAPPIQNQQEDNHEIIADGSPIVEEPIVEPEEELESSEPLAPIVEEAPEEPEGTEIENELVIEEANAPEIPIEEPTPQEKPDVQEKPTGPYIDVESGGEVLYLSLENMKSESMWAFSADYYWLNSFGSTGHTNFRGIKLWSALTDLGVVSDNSQSIKVIASDGYSMQFTAEQIRKADYIDETDNSVKLPVIIAWEEDGKAYSGSDGAPFKLIIGQTEPGDVNKPQWVSKIQKIIIE